MGRDLIEFLRSPARYTQELFEYLYKKGIWFMRSTLSTITGRISSDATSVAPLQRREQVRNPQMQNPKKSHHRSSCAPIISTQQHLVQHPVDVSCIRCIEDRTDNSNEDHLGPTNTVLNNVTISGTTWVCGTLLVLSRPSDASIIAFAWTTPPRIEGNVFSRNCFGMPQLAKGVS